MVTRIGGLASGMDIDSIVEKLMQAEKAPLNKWHQNKQKYEWQRDAYRDVNTKLKAFDDFLFGEMTLDKDLNKKTATSTNSAVSVVSKAAENGQQLTIDSVSQLAKAGNAVTVIKEKTVPNATPGGLDEKTRDPNAITMADLGLTDAQTVKMQVLQQDGKMKSVAEFTIKESDTLTSVISQLKDKAGLNAFYDQASGQLSISTKATGAGVGVGTDQSASVIVNGGQIVFEKLGFTSTPNLITNGQNAKLKINGADIERSSNTFDLEGFGVTLNNTYDGVNGQPITLTTKVDADNMVDKIKKFVETYNGLIESMNSLTKEPRYRDYAPLTEEQKKDMDEKEVEAWEKKSKSGVLRGDSIINSVLNSMRTTMYSSGGGKQDVRASSENFINTLYEMGITTSDKTSDRGKLEINETKLREAIEKDPDQVFKTISDPAAGTGLVQKLRKDIDGTIKQIEKKAGRADSTNQSFQIGRQINDADDRIDAWKVKLANIEQRYWKQFGAMETAINKANQQSSSLFSGQGTA